MLSAWVTQVGWRKDDFYEAIHISDARKRMPAAFAFASFLRPMLRSYVLHTLNTVVFRHFAVFLIPGEQTFRTKQ